MDCRVTVVEERLLGSELSLLVMSGASSITVEDPTEFDYEGGTLRIGDEDVAFTAVDEDTGVITLVGTLASGYSAEEPVYVLPLTVERIAHIAIEDEEEELQARVPHALYDRMPVGIRSELDAEAVEVEFSADELVVADILGREPIVDATYIDPDTIDLSDVPLTDGLAPASSPTPTVRGGLRFIFVEWTPISNPDPVTYEVHMSSVPEFMADELTLMGEVRGSFFVIKTEKNGDPLQYDTQYYVQIIARDDDGSAAPSAEDFAALDPAGTDDILVGAITADKLEAFLILASTIATDTEGARVEFDTEGIRLYDSLGGISLAMDAQTGDLILRGQIDFGRDPDNPSRLTSSDIVELYQQPSGTSFMMPHRVQSASRAVFTATSSLNVPFGAQTSKGNLLLLGVFVVTEPDTPPTINTPAGWTLLDSTLHGDYHMRMATFYRENAPATSSVTATLSASIGSLDTFQVQVAEYSGIAFSSAQDVKATDSDFGFTASTGTTGTTTQTDELVVAMFGKSLDAADGPWDPDEPTGYTRFNKAYKTLWADKVVTSTGTQSATVALPELSEFWIGHIATFKARSASAGPGAPDTDKLRIYAKDVNGVARPYMTDELGYEAALSIGETISEEQIWRELRKASGGTAGYHTAAYPLSQTKTADSDALADNTAYFVAIYLSDPVELTGVCWVQGAQGAYTADNNNKIGLYTSDGTTFTRVAVSANDGNLWKAATSSFATKPFTATYDASPGLYWIGAVHNRSAVTTAPIVQGRNSGILAIQNADLPLGWGKSMRATGQSDLAATYTAASDFTFVNTGTYTPWFGVH